jgi:oligopeptide transport system permease protein
MSASTPALPGASELVEGTSLWADAWLRLRKNKMAVTCTVTITLMVVACVAGPWITKAIWGYTFEAQNLDYGAQPPSWSHWMGTDFFGRDLLTRTLVGGRISLLVGTLAAVVSATLGILWGAVAGYVGGRTDELMMRFVDVLYSLPGMFIVIILVTILGKNILFVFLALAAFGWLTTARIMRGQVLSLKERDFVLAARASGTSGPMIIWRHLIPNALGPVIVFTTLRIPAMILAEAFLSFLGLGVQAPNPSLGALINEGAEQMLVYWWTLLFPGTFMAVLLFSLNFLGDGLRDALDPQMKT